MAYADLEIIQPPEGFCPSSWGDFLNRLPEFLRVNYEPNTGIITSSAVPGVADQDKKWWRTVGVGGEPADPPLYQFQNGKWRARHPLRPDYEGRLWRGTPEDIAFLDGGNSAPVTTEDGPFWEIVEEYEGRFPVGAGDLGGTTYSAGDTGGDLDYVLSEANVAPHTHTGKGYIPGNAADTPPPVGVFRASFYHEDTGHTAGTYTLFHELGILTDPNVPNEGEDPEPLTITPPFIAVYVLRRTNRVWYVA